MWNWRAGGASGRDCRVLTLTIAESPPTAPPTFSVLTLLLFCLVVPLLAQGTPPNVVLIISDDQGWGDYGFMGHPVIRTPHLDRLASESLLFPRGYVPSSVCRPSLASIITGLYPHQHLITGNDPAGVTRVGGDDPDYLRKNELLIRNIDRVATLPRLLAGQGYVSFQSGKWWEGDYSRGGFSQGMTHGNPPRFRRLGDDGLKIGREGMEPVFRFIEGVGERPFFLWYAPFHAARSSYAARGVRQAI